MLLWMDCKLHQTGPPQLDSYCVFVEKCKTIFLQDYMDISIKKI